MSFPMLENPSGDFCFYNGKKVLYSSDGGQSLLNPVSDIIYYESIRVKDGVLLFFENHMLRLLTSIGALENFPLDTEVLYDLSMKLLRESEPQVTDESIRIVVTNCTNLIHFSHGLKVPSDAKENGVTASILNWERLDPHVKVFRDDYKAAVARKFSETTTNGSAFEVLLTDHKDQITEGSRSNFFVLYHGVVYSPPEKLILIGITRRYVLKAVRKAGLVYKESLFSLADLVRMRDEAKDSTDSIALFITSSPFDILPLHFVGEETFQSAQNADLIRISEIYQDIVSQYIESRPADPIQQEC